MTTGEPVLKNVLWPVPDLNVAIDFYCGALGLRLKFRDGDRYAAIDAGGVTLALVAGGEDVTGGRPAPSYLVDSVPTAIRELTTAGAELIGGPAAGPHETRATLRDPGGQVFVVYQKS
jgi:predicted enzyme related to lactoylglutathione lyase